MASRRSESTRQEASAARRRAIVDGALALFLEQGVEETTVEDIRDRSGASVGSIYHHFGNKDGIAAEIYVEALSDYHAGFARALERHPDARKGIEATVRFHVRWVTLHPDWARFLFHMRGEEGVRAAEGRISDLNREFLRRVVEWARPHQKAGVLRRLQWDVSYALWIGPAQEFSRLWLGGRTTTPPERAARTLADAAWRALRKE